MPALIFSAFLESTHLQMRKLNPDERYRRSCRRTTSRPLSNWTDSRVTDIERERETESPLFLFTRSARQLVSFHGRFIKGGATKSSAVARKGGESQTYPTNTEIWHPECQRVAGTAEEFQLYPILPEGKEEERRGSLAI